VKDGAFSLGRIFGVEIRLHPTWFLVFALVVLSLASVGSPAGERPLGGATRIVVAVAVALLFFASVVAHELAHALVARRRGVTVKEITLFIFGGAANLEQDSPTPKTEAIIAGVGPLSSFAIAGMFLGTWAVLRGSDVPAIEIVAESAMWLGSINLLLAIFNLIPGFPMDGGRVFRAAVWAATKDFVRATRIATRVGRTFAYVLIGIGLVVALREDVIGGLWLSFIGWFLSNAADASYKRVALEKLVEGIRVRDVMERDASAVGPNLTLDTLVDQHLLSGHAAFYPVVLDGTLVGTVDIGQVSRVPRGDWPSTRVTDVMTRGNAIVTVTEPESLWQAVNRFEETGSAAIPVVDAEDQRRLLGLLTRDGVFRALRARAQLRA
jgi:Zn-dependent protease